MTSVEKPTPQHGVEKRPHDSTTRIMSLVDVDRRVGRSTLELVLVWFCRAGSDCEQD